MSLSCNLHKSIHCNLFERQVHFGSWQRLLHRHDNNSRGAGSPLIQLTISLPSSRLQQWLTGEGICRQLWGLRRHNYCSPVISPVTYISHSWHNHKQSTNGMSFQMEEMWRPHSPSFKALIKAGRMSTQSTGHPNLQQLTIISAKEEHVSFKQLRNFRERTFPEILLELGFANTVVQPLKTW